jgi:acetyltransferase-like isoleucine patch superfamily enzyme
MRPLRALLRYLAFEHGRAVGWYRRVCRPDGMEWARFLKRRGVLHAIGEDCSVQTNVTITDPRYVRLGSNVRLSGCVLFGHDGSVNMLRRAFGVVLDSVGPIDVRDDVFIGHQAIVLPGVTIGPRAIVAAGAVVTRDVPPNTIVAGVPAVAVRTLDVHVERLRRATAELPWAHLIAARVGDFDPALQPELDRIREACFFADAIPNPDAPSTDTRRAGATRAA